MLDLIWHLESTTDLNIGLAWKKLNAYSHLQNGVLEGIWPPIAEMPFMDRLCPSYICPQW